MKIITEEEFESLKAIEDIVLVGGRSLYYKGNFVAAKRFSDIISIYDDEFENIKNKSTDEDLTITLPVDKEEWAKLNNI